MNNLIKAQRDTEIEGSGGDAVVIDEAKRSSNFVQVQELDEQDNPKPQSEVETTVAKSASDEELTKQQVIDQQEYDKWLADPQNRENALSLASQIADVVGKNWFSITRLCSKAHLGRQDAYQKVQLCKLFGFIEMRLGNYRDGKENVQVPLFKVTISKEEKIKALDQIIQYHRDQIEAFEIQKKLYL